MELSGSCIKKFVIFSQKKSFLIFQKTELNDISGNKNPKNTFYIFSKERCSYILGNSNPEKKFLIYQETKMFFRISGSNFPSSKSKKTHSWKVSYILGN